MTLLSTGWRRKAEFSESVVFSLTKLSTCLTGNSIGLSHDIKKQGRGLSSTL